MTQVEAILDQIERLNAADRLALERQILERADAEWAREAQVARASAVQRGIDQAAIDDAVARVRYGQ
jgi:hypothetical protein